jgi:hypothetical protein
MRQGDKSRAALLEHRTQLMLRSGYAGTGLVELLGAAGVPKGSFWHAGFSSLCRPAQRVRSRPAKRVGFSRGDDNRSLERA